MFPIPWNFPFRKKNGDMSTIGAEIGGAGSELPPHSSSDAGKLLGVKPNGLLEWSDTVNSEIQTLTNNLDDEVKARATLGAHNLVDINGFTLIKSSARTKYIYPSDIIHGAIPSEQVVISFKVTNSNLSKSDNYFKAYGSDGEIGAVSFKANGRYSFVFDGTSFSNFYIFISSEAENDETCTISEIMITLATDAYSEYTPYAMTNRELTDAITNSYVFMGMETQTVTADGVKTYKELIEELRDTVNSYVTSLGSDYYIITRTIEIWSIQYNAILPKIARTLYDCRYRGFYFDGANTAHIRECYPSTSTNTYLKDLTFNTSSTISINDMTANAPDNGATIVANFEVYKKV